MRLLDLFKPNNLKLPTSIGPRATKRDSIMYVEVNLIPNEKGGLHKSMISINVGEDEKDTGGKRVRMPSGTCVYIPNYIWDKEDKERVFTTKSIKRNMKYHAKSYRKHFEMDNSSAPVVFLPTRIGLFDEWDGAGVEMLHNIDELVKEFNKKNGVNLDDYNVEKFSL